MSARTLLLDLVPTEPAVFSRTAATAGGHRTHHHPTGAALLGWAARRLWATFGEARAPDIFLSGRVRFSDGVACIDGVPLFAQPAILLEPKHGGGDVCLGRAAFEKKYNPDPNGKRIQADRPSLGLVALDGRHAARPTLRQRLRTATEGGRAKTGALFGYQAVEPAGQTFRATIEADANALSDSEWDTLAGAFKGTLFLGRSAANGYGGAYRATRAPASPWPDGFRGQAALLRVWFLSDTVLADEWGNPRTAPVPADFGLDEGWRVTGSESAVTARRVWPWNRVLGCRDLELPVIEAGSVVTFERPAGPVAVHVPAVVGLHRERGFGRIAVIGSGFVIREVATRERDGPQPLQAGVSPLVDWARAQARAAERATRGEAEQRRLTDIVRGLVRQLGADGPKPAQWRRVMEAAEGRLTIDEALQQDDWKLPVDTGVEPFPSLGEWVRTNILDADLPTSTKIAVIKAARDAAKKA